MSGPVRVRDMGRLLPLAVVVFLVGTGADVASTYLAVSSGRFVEGSPVGGALISRYGLVEGMLLTKLVGMVVVGFPVAVAGGNRRLVAAAMLGGVGILSLCAAAYNVAMYL